MSRVCVCVCVSMCVCVSLESLWADLERREREKDDMTEKVIKIDDGTRKNNKGRRKKQRGEDNKIKKSSSKIHQQRPMTQIFNSWNIKRGNESLDWSWGVHYTHMHSLKKSQNPQELTNRKIRELHVPD